MNQKSSSAPAGGIGLFGVLGIIFIVLKLLGYITWSWIWVLAPIWIGFIVECIAIVCIVIWFNKRT